MTTLFIICLIMLGFMASLNLILSAMADEDLRPLCFVNFLVMALAIVTVGIALGG